MAKLLVPAAHPSDSELDWFIDPYDARDCADQFQLPDSPGSLGGINDENLEILAAVLKCIPECINKVDFAWLADLLPYMELVHVETRTAEEAIEVNHYAI